MSENTTVSPRPLSCLEEGVAFADEALAEFRREHLGVLMDLAVLERRAIEARSVLRRESPRLLKEAGWKKFVFHSSYYGDTGDGDTSTVYYFSPEVNLSHWEGIEFSHGDTSRRPENDRFSEWLDDLVEGEDYIETD